MPLTRAAVENELVTKLQGKLSNRFWQLSTLTNGTNPTLNGPIRRGILGIGYTTADPISVADADLAPITGWDVERLLDWARLETLKICLGQFLQCDVKTGEDEQLLKQIGDEMNAEIAYLEKLLTEPYGPGIGPATAAVMTATHLPNRVPVPGMSPIQEMPLRRHRPITRQWPFP